MSSSKSSASTASNVTDRRIGATDKAIVATEGSQVVSTDHGAIAFAAASTQKALAENGALARKSIDGVVQATQNALKTVDKTTTESFDFSENVADGAFDLVEMVNLQSLKNVETANKGTFDISELAIRSVESSTRSDAAQSFNKLITAVAIIGGGYFFLKAVKA